MSRPLGWREVPRHTHHCAHFFVAIERHGKPRMLSMCRSTEVSPKWLAARNGRPTCSSCIRMLANSVAPWAKWAPDELKVVRRL